MMYSFEECTAALVGQGLPEDVASSFVKFEYGILQRIGNLELSEEAKKKILEKPSNIYRGEDTGANFFSSLQ